MSLNVVANDSHLAAKVVKKAHLRIGLSPTMLNAEVFFDILSLSCKTVSYHHSFHVRRVIAVLCGGGLPHKPE